MRDSIHTKDVSRTSSANDYVSIDSAPVGFSSPVELWRAPGLLTLFVILCLVLMWAVDRGPIFSTVFHNGDLVSVPLKGAQGVPFRILIVAFLISFGLFSQGRILWRLKFTADMAFSYLAMCAIIDITVFVFINLLEISVTSTAVGIASGLLGFAIFSLKLLERGNMPSRIKVYVNQSQNGVAAIRLVVVLSAAATLAVWVRYEAIILVDYLRYVSLLGGIGPGIALFLPSTFLFLYFLGRFDMRMRNKGDFSPPITVIIPAHNEEYIITDTIKSADIAAEKYQGTVILLIMDNNSTDNTSELANKALAACKHATGRVISVPTPGKAYALNAGLEAAETEYVVRIDADTQVRPRSIHFAMRHMKDPNVGVVGGLPIPPGGGMFDNARLLELVVKHGFYSVALGSVNAVVGVPGMFALYRLELPLKLGGFVQGMNGEDTDMSLRIGELGYRLIVDPRIRFYSEVPSTFHHMREQRLRWFRSVFHISSRCRDLIYSPTLTIRGKILLPFMLVNSAVRSMLVPLLLFGVLTMIPTGLTERTVPWKGVLAVLLGAPAMVAFVAAILNGSYRGILHLPEYLAFRILRAYFTLESNLSITLRDHGAHIYTRSERTRPPEKKLRDA